VRRATSLGGAADGRRGHGEEDKGQGNRVKESTRP